MFFQQMKVEKLKKYCKNIHRDKRQNRDIVLRQLWILTLKVFFKNVSKSIELQNVILNKFAMIAL